MPRNNHYRVIKCWLDNTTLIQHRKYYSASELFQLFSNELKTTYNLTLRGFTTTLNKIEENIDTFKKVNVGERKLRYIILNSSDQSSFEKTIRISQRKRRVPTPNPIKLLAFPNRIIIGNSTTSNQTQASSTNSNIASNDKEEEEVVIESQANDEDETQYQFKKSNSPEALSFFLAKTEPKKRIKI